MTDAELLQHYVKVSIFLGKMFAPILETIVHDLRKPKKSIIAITNGHITGRKVGDATSDLGIKRVKGKIPDEIINYKNKNQLGEMLKSSTLAIRNQQGKLIGSFSLNLQLSYFEKFQSFLNHFLSSQAIDFIDTEEKFHLFTPREELKNILETYLLNNGLQGKQLTTADKKEVIHYIFNRGHFNKRGAVSILSRDLGITRATLYRYLEDIKN